MNKKNIKRSFLAAFSMLAMLLGLLPGAAHAEALAAQVVVPVMGTTPAIVQMVVNDGAGGQTDPHVSGDWVSYTDNSVSGVRFQNLDLGSASERLIPKPDGYWDALSDISGSSIAFTRVSGTTQGIYLSQIDSFGNPGPAVEVSPSETTLRRRSVIGGDTIAYEDRSFDSSYNPQSEISLSSVAAPAIPAYRLTNNATDDQWPSVSPDGNVVVWVRSSTVSSSNATGDIWRAERTNGVWGAPEQVSSGDGEATLPDADGPITVYDQNNGLDRDIHWSVKDSSGAYIESMLNLPGDQINPNIQGNLIVFYGNDGLTTQFDIYLYDLANNRLYQLTNTPVSEVLTDVSVGYHDRVRVVWAQPKQVYPYDMDVYAMSFLLDTTAPVITPNIQGTLGENGWYTGDVSLTWTVTDNESPVDSTSGCDPVSITSDQAAADYTCSAESDGGARHVTASIKRDATSPVTTVTGVTEGASYELGSVPQAGCSSTDAQSGVATEATLALTGGDAQGVGSITATCSGAVDAAGNAADPAVVQYTVTNPGPVTYNFTGFFQPVDNLPTENRMKAGASVPVKFSLGGDMGLNIFSAGSPTSKTVACPSSTTVTVDAIEELTTSNSGLTYDAAANQYIYVWKTNKLWAGTCRLFTIQFADGSQQQVLFNFTR